MSQLQLIPEVQPGESFMSLAQRLAKANFHQTLQTFINRKGSHFDYRSNLNYYQEKNRWNSEIVNILKEQNYENVDNLTLNQFDGLLFGGSSTLLQRRQHYYQSKVKFCPHCLMEANYHRLVWDVSMVGVCLRHDCFLIENCTGCNRVIRMNDLIGGGCICGVKYADICEVDKPNEDILSAQRIIQGFIADEINEVVTEEGITLTGRDYFNGLDLLSKLLDGLPFANMQFVYFSVTLGEANYSLLRGDKRNLLMIIYLSTVAHHLLMSPNTNFAAVINEIEINRSSNRHMRIKRELFGKIICLEKFAAHKKIYIDFHNTVNLEFTRMKYILQPEEFRYCSLLAARKILKCDDVILKKLVDSGVFEIMSRKVGRRKLTLVEIKSVEKYAKRREEFITSIEAAMMLGVTGDIIRKLSDMKLLPIEHGPGKDVFGRRQFHPSAINRLLKELEEVCVKETSDKSKGVPFDSQLLREMHYHSSFANVLKQVLSGNISCCCDTEVKRFADVKLNRVELMNYIGSKKNK
ncbi:TniQ family protein [Paenibacillus chondroitinus]|uniref:TniQ family protein n=1 Tax=Paenibacillus chondroitinus TaxID=59842 RepID=A0ABU6DI37_9BACL|nr:MULTISPECIES: TniQ family protein [Paenibacillus]MCY9658494.1 TniQ family protein [Paenibacillus anseongense]MEB4797206.1 TniQ family protein [Paenibacillus chondroitinus]